MWETDLSHIINPLARQENGRQTVRKHSCRREHKESLNIHFNIATTDPKLDRLVHTGCNPGQKQINHAHLQPSRGAQLVSLQEESQFVPRNLARGASEISHDA